MNEVNREIEQLKETINSITDHSNEILWQLQNWQAAYKDINKCETCLRRNDTATKCRNHCNYEYDELFFGKINFEVH